MLTRTSTQSLTEQLADRFAERIRTRLLAPGARLPSVRECARQQGVSPHTVVAAYDQLLAQGLVEARRQRGFYVRDSAAAQDGRAPAPVASALSTPLPASGVPADASSLIRGMFHRQSDKPQPGMGVFPPDWMESTFMPTARAPPDQHARAAGAVAAVRRAGRATRRCAAACRRSWWASTCRPRPSRSSPPSAPRMRWTS